MKNKLSSITIALTTGEPAGIGPEITLTALDKSKIYWPKIHFVVLGNYFLLKSRADNIGLSLKNIESNKRITFENYDLSVPCIAGIPNKANSQYVLHLLDAAIKGALLGKFNAIVTAPLQKSIINDAGFIFTGHTEYFAMQTCTKRAVMMLIGNNFNISNSINRNKILRVALATTHVPISKIGSNISIPILTEILNIIHKSLYHNFGIINPIILVAGLNPHAGENGHIGTEEINIIRPSIEQARKLNINVYGPYSADTLFQPHFTNKADCILVMFHDQGLPVFKYITFGRGANITLGLPIIRTSVDHGTALDLAGTGNANIESMIMAINTAINIATHNLNFI